MTVFYSLSDDGLTNLALEETLLNLVEPSDTYLFLYENSPAVVIGRFQNPWKECHTGFARRTGVPIFRRISGGGTVVHGPGNLNWAVISGASAPKKDDNLDIMIRAVGRLGLAIRRNDRHDLLVDLPGDSRARKIAGSAFRQTSGGSFHHATLLVDADLDALRGLLAVPAREMEAKGVPSTPSPVANLSALRPGLTIDDVVAAVSQEWGGSAVAPRLDPLSFESNTVFQASRRRLASPEWIWDKTPPFVERFQDLPGTGKLSVICTVKDGRLAGLEFGDREAGSSVPTTHPPADEWASVLIGRRYRSPDLLEGIERSAPDWLQSLARRVDSDNLS